MRIQQRRNGWWQVVETSSDGETWVFDEFPYKWEADECVAQWDMWDEAWERMSEEDDLDDLRGC